jgi:hypothetical protein
MTYDQSLPETDPFGNLRSFAGDLFGHVNQTYSIKMLTLEPEPKTCE